MTELSPVQLQKLYEQLIKNKYSIIVLGPPGIGKTQSVEEFAQNLSRRQNIPLIESGDFEGLEDFRKKCPEGNCVLYIYLNLNASLPVDLAGLPDKKVVDGRTEVLWIPQSYWLACRESRYCIVVLDEFNTIENPDMLAFAMRLLSEHRAGNLKIDSDTNSVLVVALGNPPEHSSIANPLPAPLVGGKALVVRAKAPTLEEWIKYMTAKHGREWDRKIAGLLAFAPQLFIKLPEDAELVEPYPTPRGWEKSAVMCYRDPENCYVYVEGFCGREAKVIFEQYKEYVAPNLDEILKLNPGERNFKIILWAVDHFCNSPREDLKKIAQNFTEDEIALLTYITSGLCPKKNADLYKLLPKEKRSLVFGVRYGMREKESRKNPLEEAI